MSSSIRLTTSGAPDTPPLGYARIFVEDFNGKLYLKMIRPDGSIEVFGTLNTPLDVTLGGTGLGDIPQEGQFLIGTGTGYRIGDIIAGAGVNITKSATSFEISTDISNIELQMPEEFSVAEASVSGQNTFLVTKLNQDANTVYAGPNNADGTPTFRFLQVDDIPELPISKIINLIETIQAESLLVPTDSADIDHSYNATTKVLSSTIKATAVTSGSYGTASAIPTFTVKPDGRLDAASNINIAIPHTQITNFTEATQDVVGGLVVNSVSVNAEYDDYANTLKLHVNEEHLITTNISESENTRAPTSQAIKVYVDETVNLVNLQLEEVEGVVTSNYSALVTAAATETARVNQELENVYNAITAHREVITLTPALLTQEIPLSFVTETAFIMQNSVVAFADRVGLFEGLDFTIADNASGQAVLTLTPSILDILDGSEVLRISYLTKM